MNVRTTFGHPTVEAEALSDLLREGRQRARALGRDVLVSAAHRVPCDRSPVETFAAARRCGFSSALWARPSEGLWLVGVGRAAPIAVPRDGPFDRVRQAHRTLLENAVVNCPERRGVGPVLMGGFRFDPHAPPSPLWSGFPAALLVLPRLLFTTTGGECWLTMNAMVGPMSVPEEEAAAAASGLERLGATSPDADEQPALADQAEDDPKEWDRGVRTVLRAIESGHVSKVVLARRRLLRAEDDFRGEVALARLSSAYPDCAVFAQESNGALFLGASPEVLVRLDKGMASLSCLAGSIGRGATPEADGHLARQLLASEKDRREHAAVVSAVTSALGGVCADVHRDPAPGVVRLGTVQHLVTRFTARPTEPSDLLRLVQALHPTPAVGGVPTDRALHLIRRVEADRGWYAAPLGWLDHRGEGEFDVAIRSALLRGREAVLFAGSGIVRGSEPRSEMEETSLKFQPMLMALARR